ncbi:MAG TPA: hypothetical protein VKO86_03495 [Gemmatimonadales bacterium]|nr:hypothetical protein [Gemmatimonadales bacterium]
MPFHRCAIRKDDGSTIVESVDVMVEELERDGVNEWHGTMTTKHLVPLESGHRYMLVLDDGRSGEFMVRRNTFAGGTNRAVAIQGVGPLR